MKVFWFGCESSPDVGLGHLTRCIALAEELNSRDYKACFNHLSRIDSRGIEIMSSSNLTLECVCSGKPDITIVDSYEVGFINSCSTFSEHNLVLLVDEISPDVYADYYLQASPIRFWKPRNPLGSVFEFNCNPILRLAFDNFKLKSDKNASRTALLVSLGAAKNRETILEILVKTLRKFPQFRSQISVVAGGVNQSQLESQCADLGLNLLIGSYDLKTLCNDKSFVISAGGVTAWELITLEVPGFLIGVAQNQSLQINYLNENKLRRGIVFENEKKFTDDLHQLLMNEDFLTLNYSQRKVIKNGRIQAVNWLLSL
jgi:spore coat polysaccharide biosynthesis predicted glycosyltransferase SpsG